MKTAQLSINEKLIKETVLILDPFEAKHIALAMADYALKHKRSKKIAQLNDELELASMFY